MNKFKKSGSFYRLKKYRIRKRLEANATVFQSADQTDNSVKIFDDQIKQKLNLGHPQPMKNESEISSISLKDTASDVGIGDNDSSNSVIGFDDNTFENDQSDDETSFLSQCDKFHNNQDVSTVETNEAETHPPSVTMTEKLRQWALDNIASISLRAVTELLKLLRTENYEDLPTTAHQLLGFQHSIKSRPMVAKSKEIGQYIYMGITNSLLNRVTFNIYNEKVIKLYIHIDGASLFKTSRGQLWPILAKIHHPHYSATPFAVAIYYGNSKPDSVDDFMKDFVTEANELIENGVTIGESLYKVEIPAIICDGQARAFIKCIKGPTGYFSCERCTVKGIHVNKRRVYPEIDCPKRTNQSFIEKTQPEHHKGESCSPLTTIRHLDPIRSIPLDVMHLLFLNDMKFLLNKWFVEVNSCRLKATERITFEKRMTSISSCVPAEFQRKVFDIEMIGRWKATQYSFILLYLGSIVLKKVLSKHLYRHFLHFHVACRILCSIELAVSHVDQADELLKDFFQSMPAYYGPDCQTMNWHLLIHVADDVRHFQAPLTDYSAFFGENFLGKLQELVKGRARPLAQLVNKLRALESSDSAKIQKKWEICNCRVILNPELQHFKGNDVIPVQSLQLRGMLLETKEPNNVVQLKSGKIFSIRRILINNDIKFPSNDSNGCYVEGFFDVTKKNVFEKPYPSEDVGIVEVREFSKDLTHYPVSSVKSKCVFISIDNKNYAITMLHNQ